jgi:uncharacterized protein (UPF0335 family)
MKNIVLLSYKKMAQAELNTFASTVYQKMIDDAQFSAQKNSVLELKAVNDAFAVAIANAYRGSQAQTIAKNECLSTVVDRLDRLAYEVNLLANDDENVVKASGFDVRSNSTVVRELTTPTNLSAVNVPEKGAIKFAWAGSAAAINYAIEMQGSDTTVWKNGTYSTSQSVVVTGLEVGKNYAFRVCGLATRGRKSGWSDPVTVMVI